MLDFQKPVLMPFNPESALEETNPNNDDFFFFFLRDLRFPQNLWNAQFTLGYKGSAQLCI